MTAKLGARLRMYLAVINYLKQHIDQVTGLINFQTLFDEIVNGVKTIQNTSVERLETKGKAVNSEKEISRKTLVNLSIDYDRKIGAYAVFNEDVDLKKLTNLVESDIKKLPDTALIGYSQLMHKIAVPIITKLGDYGITPAEQTKMAAAIADFDDRIGKTKVHTVYRSSLTEKLKEDFAKVDENFAKMDVLIKTLQFDKPVFCNNYWKTRTIEYHSGSFSAICHVTDAKTHQPIVAAKVIFKLVQDDDAIEPVLFQKLTADKGGCYFKNITTGVYTLTVTKIGYKQKVIENVAIDNIKLLDLNIQIESE